MNFDYIELENKKIISCFNKILSEDMIKESDFFYISFCKYYLDQKKFLSICSTEELKQEIKSRAKLKRSPVCRSNRLSTINQIITYKDLAISDPDDEVEINHRKENGYKNLLSINISNEKIKYSLNFTSKNDSFNSKNLYFQNQILFNKYFCEIKEVFDTIKC